MACPVLLMARELDAGGSERQMTEIAKALDRSRFEPHVGAFRPHAMRGEELKRAGVPVVEFPVYSLKSPGAVRGAFQLARYIRRNAIQLVHTWDYPTTVFAIPVTRTLTSAIPVSSQRSDRSLIPRSYRPLVRFTDRAAETVVVNCEFLQRHMTQDEGLRREKISICYNGIDTGTFRPVPGPKLPELQDSELVIGVVCVLRREKGLALLLDAFAAVRRINPKMKLAIVGSGPMLPDLQKQAQALGIFDACLFQPAVKDVAPWLRGIDIFVLPSVSEALSNSLMEAMACGCCAVASRVGGNPELIRENETGLLFDSGDSSALAGVLQRLIPDKALRVRLAAAGERWIHERFTVRASAACMADLYEKLIGRRRKPV